MAGLDRISCHCIGPVVLYETFSAKVLRKNRKLSNKLSSSPPQVPLRDTILASCAPSPSELLNIRTFIVPKKYQEMTSVA